MAKGLQMAVELHDGDEEERRRGWKIGWKRRGEASACSLASKDGTGPTTSKEKGGEREQGAVVVLNNSGGWLGDQRRRRDGVVAGGKTGEDAATVGSGEEDRGRARRSTMTEGGGKRAPVKMEMAAFLGDDGGGRRWEQWWARTGKVEGFLVFDGSGDSRETEKRGQEVTTMAKIGVRGEARREGDGPR